MTALLALLGPKLIGGLVAVVAALVGLIKYRSSIIKAERARHKAKEIDAYEKHLQDIADAGNARPTGSMSDDPYNRDG